MSLLGSLVNRLLALTPYELKRRREQLSLPEGKVDNVQLVLAYYLASRPTASFVQIGACDGVSSDPVHRFLKQGQMETVLVEPNEQSFRRLKEAYEGIANTSLIQAAIAKHDGEISLYQVKEGALSIAPYWGQQLASFSRTHLLNHGVVADDIVEVKVPAITLPSLLQKCGIKQINILQVDTEGFDGEIVKMALDLPAVPECINFEHIHLDGKERPEVFALLERHGYEWTHNRWDTLALHERLRARWG